MFCKHYTHSRIASCEINKIHNKKGLKVTRCAFTKVYTIPMYTRYKEQSLKLNLAIITVIWEDTEETQFPSLPPVQGECPKERLVKVKSRRSTSFFLFRLKTFQSTSKLRVLSPSKGFRLFFCSFLLLVLAPQPPLCAQIIKIPAELQRKLSFVVILLTDTKIRVAISMFVQHE